MCCKCYAILLYTLFQEFYCNSGYTILSCSTILCEFFFFLSCFKFKKRNKNCSQQNSVSQFLIICRNK